MRWVALVLLAFGLFYAGLSVFNGGQRDAARRERDEARDSLAIAKVAVDECRWAVAELASSDPQPLIPFMATADDSGRWAARLFKWRTRRIIRGLSPYPLRAFPDSTDR